MPNDPEARSSFTAKIPSWLDKRLDKIEKDKSDRAVVKAEFKRVDGEIEDLKTGMDKGHVCLQEGDLRTMESGIATNKKSIRENTEVIRSIATTSVDETKKLYRWYIRGLAAMLVFLLTTGAGFVWYLAGMAFHLEAQGKALEKVEKKVETTPASSVEEMIEDAAQRAAQKTASQMRDHP